MKKLVWRGSESALERILRADMRWQQLSRFAAGTTVGKGKVRAERRESGFPQTVRCGGHSSEEPRT